MTQSAKIVIAILAGLMASGQTAPKPAAAPEPAAKPAPAITVTPAAPAPQIMTNYYRRDANAAAQVEGAVAEAKAGGRQAILVFGADWCSDSTALAAVLTSDMFKGYLGNRYSVTFIDVNRPTKGDGRNQDLTARYGIEKMTGTPEVLVIGKDGKPINSIEDAHSWRNAGDRPILKIMRYFYDLKPAASAPAKAN